MDWTLADIRTLVRKLTGKPSTQQMSDADMLEEINHFYQNEFPVITGLKDFEGWDTIATVASTQCYDIDSGIISIDEPWYISDPSVLPTLDHSRIWVTFDRLLYYHNYPISEVTTEGRPVAALIEHNRITLSPVPDQVYTLSYYYAGKPVAFVLDADMPLDPSWGPAIAFGAAINIKVSDGDVDGANELVGMFREKISIVTARDQKIARERRAYPSF